MRIQIPQGAGLLRLFSLRQKTISNSRPVDGDDSGLIGLFGGSKTNEKPVRNSRGDPPQSNRADHDQTYPPLGLPTIGWHPSSDLLSTRTN